MPSNKLKKLVDDARHVLTNCETYCQRYEESRSEHLRSGNSYYAAQMKIKLDSMEHKLCAANERLEYLLSCTPSDFDDELSVYYVLRIVKTNKTRPLSVKSNFDTALKKFYHHYGREDIERMAVVRVSRHGKKQSSVEVLVYERSVPDKG